jgi:thiol:disulfide interchange protein
MKNAPALILAVSLCAGTALAAPPQAVPTAAKPAAAEKPAVPFVANDYQTVLADARQRNVPVFVDNWAVW